MSDVVEFEHGRIVFSSYEKPHGTYHYSAFLRMALESSRRRGKWIGELRDAINTGNINEAKRVLDTVPSTVGAHD